MINNTLIIDTTSDKLKLQIKEAIQILEIKPKINIKVDFFSWSLLLNPNTARPKNLWITTNLLQYSTPQFRLVSGRRLVSLQAVRETCLIACLSSEIDVVLQAVSVTVESFLVRKVYVLICTFEKTYLKTLVVI